jgi:superfamily I DNA/RNA helicase
MMTTAFTVEQQAAIESNFGNSLLISGVSGTGKTAALEGRVERYERATGASYLFARHPRELIALAEATFEVCGRGARIADEIEARRAFERCAQPLLDLAWPEIESGELDPEVAALRAPARFLESAFRLIRKLRDGAIDPQTFLNRSLAGATDFYAKPPNFAHADLIRFTKDAYRDSLAVSSDELQRQYRREIDLAKVLHHLYEAYVTLVRTSDSVSPSDAIVLALEVLRATPQASQTIRERFAHVFVDEMQEATPAQRALLDAIYGSPPSNITLAGDARVATNRFRGARPESTLAGIERTIELTERRRERPTLALHRAKTQADEAAFIAEHVAEQIERGVPPGEIALLFRTSADVHVYVDALLDRDIPVAAGGDVNIFSDRRALDALALLWNVWDPFRHEWMLRTLAGKAMALSDATLATLCSEPPDPQTPLFVLDDEPAPTARASRWDPKRDLRLGWNVLRGDADRSLNSGARKRVERFRELRADWVTAMTALPLAVFARKVWAEGLALDGRAGSARARSQQQVLRELLNRLLALHQSNPGATLGDLLGDIRERGELDGESCEAASDPAFVHALSIDAARGRTFAHTIVPDARAGSFPRWYVPDSFLWSPSLGMIPRDNAGDAQASRTAKFSYYLYRSKAREAYNVQERVAFEYALSRSRATALVTAWGPATRGITAPEFLEELRNAR